MNARITGALALAALIGLDTPDGRVSKHRVKKGRNHETRNRKRNQQNKRNRRHGRRTRNG